MSFRIILEYRMVFTSNDNNMEVFSKVAKAKANAKA